VDLALDPDGVHIGRNLFAQGQVGRGLVGMLGAATRTNQLADSELIYAYDRQGLVIYSQPGGGEHLVLDFDAMGGTNGAMCAFSGTLQIGGETIRADMDSQTLAGNQTLGLTNSVPDGTVLGGEYKGMGLVFAYFKSRQRLTLIQIDLGAAGASASGQQR
jgi:hypothetical protein